MKGSTIANREIYLFLQLKKETFLKKSNIFTVWDGLFKIQRHKGQNNQLCQRIDQKVMVSTPKFALNCVTNLKITFSSVYVTFLNLTSRLSTEY